jgi:hypothetical protein
MDFLKVLVAFVGWIFGGFSNRGKKTQVELGLDNIKQSVGLWGAFTVLIFAFLALIRSWIIGVNPDNRNLDYNKRSQRNERISNRPKRRIN